MGSSAGHGTSKVGPNPTFVFRLGDTTGEMQSSGSGKAQSSRLLSPKQHPPTRFWNSAGTNSRRIQKFSHAAFMQITTNIAVDMPGH